MYYLLISVNQGNNEDRSVFYRENVRRHLHLTKREKIPTYPKRQSLTFLLSITLKEFTINQEILSNNTTVSNNFEK